MTSIVGHPRYSAFRKYVLDMDQEGFPHGSEVKNPPSMQEPQEMRVGSSGQEDPLEEGMATPPVLQYSCLENPMDRGAWRAAVHRVAKSWTRLK